MLKYKLIVMKYTLIVMMRMMILSVARVHAPDVRGSIVEEHFMLPGIS